MRYGQGMEKGPRYYRYYMSDKKSEPKVESDYTLSDFVVELAQQIDGVTKPDGSREFPAKSCKDLKLTFPEVQSGLYWMDPNAAKSADSFQAQCRFSGEAAETCIDANDMILPEKEGERLWWHRFEYPADSVQLELLRIGHTHSRQNFTFQCKNIAADLRVRTDDDQELEAGRRSILQVLSDTCSEKANTWEEAVLEIDTSLTSKLPIADVGVVVDGEEGEFMLQMGPICFT
jgi:hypothetical protein